MSPFRSRKIDPEVVEEPSSAPRYLAAIFGHYDMTTGRESVGQSDPEAAGKVIVAGARRPERLVQFR